MSSNKNVHSTYVYKGKLNVRAPHNLSNSCDKEGGAPLVPWILKQSTKLKPSSRTVSEWIMESLACATLTAEESQCSRSLGLGAQRDSKASVNPDQCDSKTTVTPDQCDSRLVCQNEFSLRAIISILKKV